MEFCPECGAMMLPNNGELKCNSCGYVKGSSEDSESYKLSGTIEEHETVTNLGEVEDLRSTIKETCPECGHDEAYYELKQTRSADEAPTRIFTCAKCKHTWRAYHWGLFMKDSKEKEHRISNLQDMINNVKEEEDIEEIEDIEEDVELIDYLNENDKSYEELEIDDEFIYHPGDDDNPAVNLEENNIDENFIIKTPKESEKTEASEEIDSEDLGDEITGEISENFDNIMHAKIGRTPIMGVVSTILGLVFIILAAITFESRSERIVDNVTSGETTFIFVILLIIGLLLLIYGLYKVIGLKNPLLNISTSIDSIESEDKENTEKMEQPDENVIPKSNIPLDKESYKIGEFNMSDLKSSLKKSFSSRDEEVEEVDEEIDVENLPPAKEKDPDEKGLIKEEIEEREYEQARLDGESIDEIFADVENLKKEDN